MIRQKLGEEIARLREELSGVQVRVKNLKSQIPRLRAPDAERQAELKEQIGTGEARAVELKREIPAGSGRGWTRRTPQNDAVLRGRSGRR